MTSTRSAIFAYLGRLLIYLALVCGAHSLCAPTASEAKKTAAREELRKMLESSVSAEKSKALYSSYLLCHRMRENGARKSFTAAFFCAEVERILKIPVPVGWQIQLERTFATPPQPVISRLGAAPYKIEGSKLIGSAASYDLPPNFAVNARQIYVWESDEWLCTIAVEREKLTELLVYNKADHSLVHEVTLSFSMPVGGQVTDIGGQVHVFFWFAEAYDTLVIFTAVQYTHAIEAIRLKSGELRTLFHSGTNASP